MEGSEGSSALEKKDIPLLLDVVAVVTGALSVTISYKENTSVQNMMFRNACEFILSDAQETERETVLTHL